MGKCGLSNGILHFYNVISDMTVHYIMAKVHDVTRFVSKVSVVHIRQKSHIRKKSS